MGKASVIGTGSGYITVGVGFTPDGSSAYVTTTANTVIAVDTATSTAVASIATGGGPWGVAVTPDGSAGYVTNSSSGTVTVLNTASNAITTTVNGFSNPHGLAIVNVAPVATSMTAT